MKKYTPLQNANMTFEVLDNIIKHMDMSFIYVKIHTECINQSFKKPLFLKWSKNTPSYFYIFRSLCVSTRVHNKNKEGFVTPKFIALFCLIFLN